MSTSTVPPPTPDAKLSAVSAKQAAIIGAVAVLLSGLLSLGAGVVSANIAGASAVRATTLQLSGENEKSRAEFLRTQRQRVYASVITQDQSTRKDEIVFNVQVSGVASGGPVYDPGRVKAQWQKVALDIVRMENTWVTVQLIGSSGASEKLSDLIEAHRKYFETINEGRYLGDILKMSEKTWEARVDRMFEALVTASQAFLDVARKDLGATD